jgi:hypothetical protein
VTVAVPRLSMNIWWRVTPPTELNEPFYEVQRAAVAELLVVHGAARMGRFRNPSLLCPVDGFRLTIYGMFEPLTELKRAAGQQVAIDPEKRVHAAVRRVPNPGTTLPVPQVLIAATLFTLVPVDRGEVAADVGGPAVAVDERDRVDRVRGRSPPVLVLPTTLGAQEVTVYGAGRAEAEDVAPGIGRAALLDRG